MATTQTKRAQQDPEQGGDGDAGAGAERDEPPHHAALLPSDVSRRVGVFDRFAGAAANIASRATFFAFCVLLILVWLPSFFLIGNIDTWQLVINTATTIVTFLLVALLQNSQTRSDLAVQHKLNALADALSDLMAHMSDQVPERDLAQDMAELRAAVGLETHESTSKNET